MNTWKGRIAVCLLCLAFAAPAWGKYLDEASVARVQEKLNALGYDCGEADGVAGNKTIEAIVSFQRKNNLTANGMVTDELLEALGLEDDRATDEAEGAALEEDESVTEGGREETEEVSHIWDDTYNLLVIGTDRRSGTGWNGNSDVNILITLNHSTKKIYMVSFMRDLYADIPGYGAHKLNYAYAAAGPDKLIETLSSNFGVHVDNWVCVDWAATAAIVDMFGGVDIEIHDYEIDQVNDYAADTGRDLGIDVGGYIVSSGYQHLTGVQAVGYSRVRFVGDNDYERTERQRNVLSCLADKVRSSSKADILKNMTQVMTLVSNNLTPVDILWLAGEYAVVRDYELVRDRVPFDGMFYNQNEMLVPDEPATNERLLGEIYAG